MFNAHDVTKEFESALSRYTGAPYVVTTTSCTQAILMALSWLRQTVHFEATHLLVSMPKFSYVGVPASILNAGYRHIAFRDIDWQGEYEFGEDGAGVWDSARRFTSGMYRPGAMQCISMHWSKILGLSQGGAVLLDDPEAAAWMRRFRFDGRTEGVDPKDDDVMYPSAHAYLSPEVSAHGLMKLSLLPLHNADLPRSDYPDLSKMKAFK